MSKVSGPEGRQPELVADDTVTAINLFLGGSSDSCVESADRSVGDGLRSDSEAGGCTEPTTSGSIEKSTMDSNLAGGIAQSPRQQLPARLVIAGQPGLQPKLSSFLFAAGPLTRQSPARQFDNLLASGRLAGHPKPDPGAWSFSTIIDDGPSSGASPTQRQASRLEALLQSALFVAKRAAR